MPISTEQGRTESGRIVNSRSNYQPSQDHILLDRDGALKRLGGDQSLFADLAQVFCEDGPPLMERLTIAVEKHDREGILRASHALRGLASNFGAEALMHPLRQVEESARRGELEDIPQYFEEAQFQSERLQKELSRYL